MPLPLFFLFCVIFLSSSQNFEPKACIKFKNILAKSQKFLFSHENVPNPFKDKKKKKKNVSCLSLYSINIRKDVSLTT